MFSSVKIFKSSKLFNIEKVINKQPIEMQTTPVYITSQLQPVGIKKNYEMM